MYWGKGVAGSNPAVPTAELPREPIQPHQGSLMTVLPERLSLEHVAWLWQAGITLR